MDFTYRKGSEDKKSKGQSALGQSVRVSKDLLANKQEPAARVPPATEPAVAEKTPAGVAAQHRDEPTDVIHRERAQCDDPELALKLRMLLLKCVCFYVSRGTISELIHLGDVVFGPCLTTEVFEKKDLVSWSLVNIFT